MSELRRHTWLLAFIFGALLVSVLIQAADLL